MLLLSAALVTVVKLQLWVPRSKCATGPPTSLPTWLQYPPLNMRLIITNAFCAGAKSSMS